MPEDLNIYKSKEIYERSNVALVECSISPEQAPETKTSFNKGYTCLKVFLALLGGYLAYNYFNSHNIYFTSYNDLQVYTKDNDPNVPHKLCNPNLLFKLNSTVEVDPEQFASLGLGVFGNAKYSSVRFHRHNSSKITLDHEIFTSNAKIAESIRLVTKNLDGNYGAAFTQPKNKHESGCYQVNLVVNIPENLKSMDKIYLNLANGDVKPDFNGLQVDNIEIHVNVGSIHLNGKEANSIYLSTHVGSISLSNSNAQSVTLLTSQGSISTFNVKSRSLYSRTMVGATSLNLVEAGSVYVKSYSGYSNVNVGSIVNTTYNVLAHKPSSHAFEKMFSEFLPKRTIKNRKEAAHSYSKTQSASSLHPKKVSKGVNQYHTGNHFIVDNYNSGLLLSLPASFHTSFVAKAYNGKAKVSVPENSTSFHFDTISYNSVSGYNFQDHSNSVRVTTYNGSPEIDFY